jgi:hypothetical protein
LGAEVGILEVLARHGVPFVVVGGHAGTDAEELFATSIQSPPYRCASLEWLRRMKRASGRPKDLEDLKDLPET